MLFILLCLVMQGLWCSEVSECAKEGSEDQGQERPPGYSLQPSAVPPLPEYSKFGPLHKSTSTYMATVEFKAPNEKLYQVRWDLYCSAFNGSCSIEAVLERSLLAGDERGIFLVHKSELERMIVNSAFGLKACLERKERIHYQGIKGRRLCKNRFAEMFPEGEYKQWRVLKGDQNEALTPGEIRFLFDEGGLSCTPSCVRGVRDCIKKGTSRFKQMQNELTDAFVAKVRYYAEEKKRFLREAAWHEGENVDVRYVNGAGKVLSVCWDGRRVCDAVGRYLLDFLQDCVLLGTNLGYVDEECEKHYAFRNDNLCELLRVGLAFDLSKKQNTIFKKGAHPLKQEVLQKMPYMTWTVVPPDCLLRRATTPYTCAISFAGAILEGCPSARQIPVATHFIPRNFLWAACYDEIKKQHPGAVCFYKQQVGRDIPRLRWCLRA